jgi:menaquinone-9 beta-reductase
VGLFARDAVITAPMPAARGCDAWGRAIARDRLDTALLDHAIRAGAQAWQPWMARSMRKVGGEHTVTISGHGGEVRELRSRIVIAAHGSWERSPAREEAPHPTRASDLIGFKAHFHASRLAAGLMPLVLFPGGYGGMVHGDGGRVSFSCCIRRAALRKCREEHSGLAAGEAVIAHVAETCRGVREALSGARREAAWLSAGPIRPGVRSLACEGIFSIGNTAGEAHPLVAEGISMAIQSAWLLGGHLASRASLCDDALQAAAIRYRRSWRRHFSTRVRASSIFATLTTSPATQALSIALLTHAPAILTWGAWWSGKSHALHPAELSA